MTFNRRAFLKQAGVTVAAAYMAPSILSCDRKRSPKATLREIGLQLYTLRDQLADSAASTLNRVAEIGYNHVETFGPETRADGQIQFWGLNLRDLSGQLLANGLKSYSGHYDLSEFLTPGNGNEEALKIYLDTAAELGQKYMIVPIPPMPLIDQLTADHYHFMADQLNKGGHLAAGSGIKIGYHNHFWEFRTLENGSRGLDILLENTEKDLVVFELDLFWSEKSGADSVAYFQKHPGRFPLWHIKDMDKANTDPVTGPDYDNRPVMEITSAITYAEVGTGNIDFKKIMAQAETAGLKYAFVEQDLITIDPFESVEESYEYVKTELLK